MKRRRRKRVKTEKDTKYEGILGITKKNVFTFSPNVFLSRSNLTAVLACSKLGNRIIPVRTGVSSISQDNTRP